MFKRILVPVDGSETSNKALVAALQLAREGNGRVRIVHFLDDLTLTGYDYGGQVLDYVRVGAQKVIDDAMTIANASGIPADSKLVEELGLRLGDVVAREAGSWQADLVVVGTHGRRGVGRVLLGSGAEQVIRMAPVPVLAVRNPESHKA